MTRYRLNYLARRNPSLTHERFVERWREHFRLASSRKEWSTVRRYIQNEVMDNELSRSYDGVATVEYHSLEQRNSNRAAAEYHRILQEDERHVFDSLVHNFSFIGSHDVLQGPGVGPVKVIRFLKRTPDLSSKEFMSAWRGEYARRLIDAAESITSVAQNLPIPPERPEGWGLKVDGSEEIWFGTLAAAEAFRRSDAALEIRNQFEPSLFTVVAEVVTVEVILHDT